MADKYLKTDVEGLVKDPTSGAVLNVDNAKLAAYRAKKAAAEKVTDTNERLAKVESDMSEIKSMLLQLLGNKN